jgi:glutathione S-transferase
VPFFIKPITKAIAGRVDSAFLTRNFDTHFGFLESQLASSPNGGDWLCGKELTAADIMMSFPLISRKGRIDEAKYPKIAALIKKYEEHPVYLQSVKRIEEATGEKFQAML